MQITPVSNDMHIMKFLSSPTCNFHPFACQAKMKFEQYRLEVQYIYKVFHAIYKKFLTALDHIDYHPSQQYHENTTRRKEANGTVNMDGTIPKQEY